MKIKVGKYYLDKEQLNIVKDNSKHLLVVAGAGSGKTLTILGKIKYLIENKGIDSKEIICVSFTAASSLDVKNKIKNDLGLSLEVYTFHKLALEVLKTRTAFDISDPDTLEAIIREFLREDILKNKDSLKIILRYFKLKSLKEYTKFYDDNFKEIVALERLLSTFIHLFKANNYEMKDFLTFLDDAKKTLNIKKYKREKLFLTLAILVYKKYTDYLEENDEIDFDDMLIKAKKTVDNYGFFHSIKYVIIDEFQDTSKVRFDFIKSILNKTEASLIAVGDDFQSIYRFTGCDLDLFLNFKNIFEDAKILKIQNTYRNSQELINVAGKFVMKNRRQMRKNLKSQKSISQPIVLKTYKNPKESLTKLILDIYSKNRTEILILGRNNNDIDFFLDEKLFKRKNEKIYYIKNNEIDITYLTVHKSKGLESENVILINLRNDTLGFPSQIKDDKVLRFVSSKTSKFPFDEERRLFYVALTRTKNKVFLLTPKYNRSIFVDELLKDYKEYIEVHDTDIYKKTT